MSIRIMLALDQGILCEGLKVLIGKESHLRIVGETHGCDELGENLRETNANIVLLDVDAVSMKPMLCAEIIKRDFPNVRMLIMAMSITEQQMRQFLDAGTNGIILKNTSKEELTFALDKIANNGTYIDPEFILHLLSRNRNPKSESLKLPARAQEITDREMQVLELIAQGKTNAQMAKELFVSVRAIETRRKKILEKTGTTNTATLIKFAVEHGLIK